MVLMIETLTVRSRRLDLVPMVPEFIEAVLCGRRQRAEAVLDLKLSPEWPRDQPLDAWLARLRGDGSLQPWLARVMVLTDGRVMVGDIGFHGPPATLEEMLESLWYYSGERTPIDGNGVLEIGYSVLPRFRRRGFAYEATQRLMEWAHTEHGVRSFVASVSADNAPSIALTRKLGGFRRVGLHTQRDGSRAFVFRRDFPES